MRNYLIIGNAAALFSMGLLFCSKFGDSTNLGADVINDVSPDKVTIDKHLRQYIMDSSAVQEAYSLPGANDIGYGLHVSDSILVLGTQTGERANGYIQFTIPPDDTGENSKFGPVDTLLSVTLRLTRDSLNPPCNIQVWHSNNRAHVLSPSDSIGDSRLDTMDFAQADINVKVNVPDTITLPDWLENNVFKACTTSKVLKPDSASFGFILKNVSSGVLAKLPVKGSFSALTVTYKHGTDTGVKTVRYSISKGASLYQATDADSADSWRKKPMLVYSSERIAVFRYSTKALWEAVGMGDISKGAEIVSAGFTLKSPVKGDSLKVMYFLWHERIRDCGTLDSMFAKNTESPPGTAVLTDTASVAASVFTGLSNYEQETMNLKRYPELYLYLRLVEDPGQVWKRYLWSNVPLLKAMLATQ